MANPGTGIGAPADIEADPGGLAGGGDGHGGAAGEDGGGETVPDERTGRSR